VIDLAGASALVTGGSGGIGSAVVRRLLASGAAVVVADVDSRQGPAAAAALGAEFVHTDVASLADLAAAVAAAEARGPLRFVHLNAGISSTMALEDVDEALYRRALGVNLDGVFWGIRAALPAMRRAGGGAIVATSSLAGLVPQPADPVYSATKTAVIALVRSIGPTVRDDGIRLNCVCPGFADTPMVPDALRQAGFPLLSADEVAEAVLHIAASESDSQAYFLQPGRPLAAYVFHGVPGARAPGRDASEVVPDVAWAHGGE